MTPATMIILLGLIVFWGISLQNVLKNKGSIGGDRSQSPMSAGFILAASGTVYSFAETLALIALDLTGNLVLSPGLIQWLGLALFFSGCVLHAWSVAARGKTLSLGVCLMGNGSSLIRRILLFGILLIWVIC